MPDEETQSGHWWFRVARVAAFGLALHAGFLSSAIVVAAVRRPDELEFVALGAGTVLGVLLAVYLLFRLPRSGPALLLAATFLAAVELFTIASPSRFLAASGFGEGLATVAARAGPWSEPVLSLVFVVAPYWIGQFTFVGMVLFATRFPRPLSPTDLWIRQRRRGEPGIVRRAWTRFRVLLLNPWAAVLIVGAIVYGATALTWWVENLVDVAVAGLTMTYFLDSLAVGSAEDRSRAGWMLAGFGAAALLLSVYTLYQAIPELVAVAGPSVRMPDTANVLMESLAVVAPFVGFALLAVAVLGRGAMDPGIAVRRTAVFSALGVVLTLAFAILEEAFTEWTVDVAGIPGFVGPVVAASVVLALAPPLRWVLDRLFGPAISARFAQAIGETERRRAVVLSAEFAGYQARVADDPRGAVELVQLLRARAGRLRGRLARATADQVLLEYADAETAIADAVALRHDLVAQQANAGHEPARLRIAVHVGEVVSGPDGDVLGPGAKEVESLRRQAAPDEILLSADVVDTLALGARLGLAAPAAAGDEAWALDHFASAEAVPTSRRLSAPLGAAGVVAAAATLLVLAPGSAPTEPVEPDAYGLQGDSMYDAGEELTAAEAHRLERRALSGDGDLATRALLFRYHRARYFDRPYRWDRISFWRSRTHARWLIEHHPGAPVLGLATYLNWSDRHFTRPLDTLWADQAEAHPDDSDVRFSAALFRVAGDDTAGIELLEAGTERFPDEARWPLELGVRHFLAALWSGTEAERRAEARRALAALGEALDRAPTLDEERRAIMLTIRVLGVLDRVREAKPPAERLLAMPGDSTERAYATHLAHTTLGLIRLEQRDRAAAERHLQASIRDLPATLYSARMTLAAALLETGATAAVLDYLEACRDAITGRYPRDRIEEWIEAVRNGKMPEFGMYVRL